MPRPSHAGPRPLLDLRGEIRVLAHILASVPAALLADLLGIHTTTAAADWARAAGGDWSDYAAEIARTRRKGSNPRCMSSSSPASL
jgi:hypothetical protein